MSVPPLVENPKLIGSDASTSASDQNAFELAKKQTQGEAGDETGETLPSYARGCQKPLCGHH